MGMTAVETRVEAKRCLDQAEAIELRYGGQLTEEANADDYREVKRLLGRVDELEAKLPGLEDAERRMARITEGKERFMPRGKGIISPVEDYRDQLRTGAVVSPGRQFINSHEYKQRANQGDFLNSMNRIDMHVPMAEGTSLVQWHQRTAYAQRTASDDYEQKALMNGSAGTTGPLVFPDIRPGVLEILTRPLTFLDVVPRLTTNSDVVEYIVETTFTNNAAFTAEATATTGTSGTKPESALAYTAQTATVQTLAHWIPITNRLLADAPAIRGIIDSRLLLGLSLTLETQIVAGNGSGVNFTGILNTANVLTQGVQAGETKLDAILRGRTNVRINGHAIPTVVVMHPTDFQTIRLLREGVATGTYLVGPPTMGGPTTLWSMTVVESEAVTQGTAIVTDPVTAFALIDREQSAVRVGLINDQFTRNIQTILAELRAAFVVWRPSAVCLVTGL